MKRYNLSGLNLACLTAILATTVSVQAAERGKNPLSVCSRPTGVTPYPDQGLGCYRVYDPVYCRCAPWSDGSGGSDLATVIVSGNSGGNHQEIQNDLFQKNLKALTEKSDGPEKQLISKDLRAFERTERVEKKAGL